MKLNPKRKNLYSTWRYRRLGRRPNCFSAILSLIILLTSCSANSPSKTDSGESTEAGISITLMDPYDASTDIDLAGERFTVLKEEWIATHPDIQLKETVIRADNYSTVISEYASQNSLPDIFLIPSNNLDIWSDWGFVADVPGYENKTILSAPVFVAYDTELWKEAGYDTFPETWEELAQVNAYFLDLNYDSALGTPALTSWIVSSCFMPRIFAENCGTDWMNDMITGTDRCIFLEDSVLNALDEVARITESKVLTGYGNSVEAYINNHCPAAVITLSELSTLQNSDKDKQTAFSLLPVSEESLYGAEIYDTYYSIESYALVINAEAVADSEKLQLCVDFCNFITAIDTDELYKDAQISILLNASREVPNYVYGISRSAADSISGALQTWMYTDPESRVPEEIANSMQNGYEKYN